MSRYSTQGFGPAGLAMRVLVLASILGVAACAGPHPVAHIPVSGISGNSGGSELTLYYDGAGKPHFQS